MNVFYTYTLQICIYTFDLQYFNDPDALKYIDGVAVHWYLDSLVPPVALQLAKTDKKDIFLISTEACTGRTIIH